MVNNYPSVPYLQCHKQVPKAKKVENNLGVKMGNLGHLLRPAGPLYDSPGRRPGLERRDFGKPCKACKGAVIDSVDRQVKSPFQGSAGWGSFGCGTEFN